MGKIWANLLNSCLAHFFTICEVRLIKIDKEYNCVWWNECEYLMNHGIRYEFVKEMNGVTTWKFKKNEKLFLTLAQFYSNVYSK